MGTGCSHRDVEVGVGEVLSGLEFASVKIQSVADKSEEGEEKKEEDEVAGEVYQVGPPARRALDIHLQLLKVRVRGSVDSTINHQLELG